MRQALYRKYRSKSFGEVVGQEHITKTLQAAIKSGRISHAYLFTGPRGVGKTSVARILAHEVNQLPYKGESLHLDIIEIDAASNRRIDEIRDLRERVRIAPTSSKYKVYIIDEVHMLTRESFNALLKTLEEPPEHCIFILATTEAHKLPDTIISRTQRFEFKPLGPSDVAKHLEKIAKQEKITIEKEALDMLADFGQGSFRDSISYLDQLSSQTGRITVAEVREILGFPSAEEVNKLLSSIRAGNLNTVFESLSAIRNQGVDAAQAAAALSAEIRELAAAGNADIILLNLLKQLLQVPASSKPFDYFEIVVMEAAQQNITSSSGNGHGPQSDEQEFKGSKTKNPAINQGGSKVEGRAASMKKKFNPSSWDEVVVRAKDKAASIYTALRLAEPDYEEGILTLKFEFPLHQKKIEQAKNKQMVASIVEEISGEKVTVRCVVDKEIFRKSPAEDFVPATSESHSLTSINNIFGSAEVLES